MDDLVREEVLETVDRAVAGLLDAAGITGPPVDAIALGNGISGWSSALIAASSSVDALSGRGAQTNLPAAGGDGGTSSVDGRSRNW